MNRPRWDGRRGRYEAYYVKAVQGDASAWLRYTILAPVDGEAVAQVWAIVDDRGRKSAGKATHPVRGLRLGKDGFSFETPAGRLDGDGCRGEAGPVRWRLSWEPTKYSFRHLPRPMYHMPLPRTKVNTPNPDLRVTGTVEVEGRTFRLEGAPGQQGHVWGTKHALAWAWSHCNTGPVVWEALTAQVPLGSRPSPPLTTVLVRHEGRTLAFRVLWRAKTRFDLDGYEFRARRGRWTVEGEVEAKPGLLGCVTYTDPDGEPAYCHNTKRASSLLRLHRDGNLVGEWRDAGGTAYEVGLRRRDPETPLLL